jgi:hypothetical protein
MVTVDCRVVFEGGKSIDIEGCGGSWRRAWANAEAQARRHCRARGVDGNIKEDNGIGAAASIIDGHCEDYR